jgi:hypothetical protein
MSFSKPREVSTEVQERIVQFKKKNQLSMSKFPQRPGCTTLKPFVSGHLYRKISLDQV